MQHTTPTTLSNLGIVHAVVFCPRTLSRYIASQPKAIWRIVRVSMGAATVIMTILTLIMVQFVAFDRRFIFCLLIALPMSVVIAVFGAFPNNIVDDPLKNYMIALSYAVLASFPYIAVVCGLSLGLPLTPLQNAVAVVALIFFLVRSLADGMIFGLIATKKLDDVYNLRRIVAIGSLCVAIELSFSQPIWQNYGLVPMIVVLSLVAGSIHLSHYLWQAPWSSVLWLLAWKGVDPVRLLRLHPVSNDELCLLPMPGLRSLLLRATMRDYDVGCEWLLRVAQHPSYERVAAKVIGWSVRRGEHAHPLLLRLSLVHEGALLLRYLVCNSRRADPLISAYVAFASNPTPELWPYVLGRHLATFGRAVHMPQGRVVEHWLATASIILRSTRWQEAQQALDRPPMSVQSDSDPIISALMAAQLRWMAQLTGPVDQVVQHHAELPDTELSGWLLALNQSVHEHLGYLAEIEHIDLADTPQPGLVTGYTAPAHE